MVLVGMDEVSPPVVGVVVWQPEKIDAMKTQQANSRARIARLFFPDGSGFEIDEMSDGFILKVGAT
jgi:hypothetical protein